MSVAGTTAAWMVCQKAFRDVVGRFASGVTVITTSVDGQPLRDDRQRHVVPVDGSADAAGLPEQDQRTGGAVLKAQSFAVNILPAAQEQLAGKFAVKGADKIFGVAVHAGLTGSPLLDGSLATIECRRVETVTGGTRTVLLAGVLTAEAREVAPLTQFRGGFGRPEQAKEKEPTGCCATGH